MNSPQDFLAQLKKAQFHNKQNKSNIQATTKAITKVATMATNTNTNTNTTTLTEHQYKNIILAKAITYIRGQA